MQPARKLEPVVPLPNPEPEPEPAPAPEPADEDEWFTERDPVAEHVEHVTTIATMFLVIMLFSILTALVVARYAHPRSLDTWTPRELS